MKKLIVGFQLDKKEKKTYNKIIKALKTNSIYTAKLILAKVKEDIEKLANL